MQTTVYAIKPFVPPLPASKNFDLALQYQAVTDTSVTINGQQKQAVLAGKKFASRITLINYGPGTAKQILLWAVKPPMTTSSNYSDVLFQQKTDTLFWRFDSLNQSASKTISFDINVPSPLSSSPLALRSTSQVQASLDTTDLNNHGEYTVYGLYKAPLPTAAVPYIEAQPPVIEVGDSVVVRVRVVGEISSWALWVRFSNGKVDSSYANSFILNNPAISANWLTIVPQFGNTHLFTAAVEEEIVFELRIKDQYGRAAQAQAAVLIHSKNRLKLDRNIFEPDRQDPLAIQFKLSSNRLARIDIYDLAGVHICRLSEADYQAGWNTYYWNGRIPNGMLVGSGVYIITLHSGDYKDWKKCMIVR